MTSLDLFSPSGHAETHRAPGHPVRVLRLGQRVEISAVGGRTDAAGVPGPENLSLEQEARQAFDNLAQALASAGASWRDVVHVNSYHVPVDGSIGAGVGATSTLFRELMPERPPVWTCIGVTGFADQAMRLQLRVTAILGERPAVLVNEGFGTILRDQFHFGQAVRLDDGQGGHRIEISGQGGWNDAFEFPETLEAEYRQSFDNVGRVLALAGATWADVTHVNSYHKTGAGELDILAVTPAAGWMRDGLRRHMPGRQPVWTGVGTPALGDDRMNVEIRVTAVLGGQGPAEFLVTAGAGEKLQQDHAMSQVVRQGLRIEISAQGGWDAELRCPPDVSAQHCLAMENVGRALAAAGASWHDVVQVHSYHVPSGPDGSIVKEASLMTRLLAAFMPRHVPLWTCLGVPALGDASMRVAVRVVAVVPQ